MGVTLFLVLSATAVAIFYCARQRVPAHLLTLAPAVLVSLVLMQSDTRRSETASDWRVTLAGLQFRLAPGQVIRFGGDARTDHVFVRGMPAGLLTLQRTAAGEVVLEQSTLVGGTAIIRDLDASSSAAAYEPQWGGIALAPDVEFCRSDRPDCNAMSLSWSLRQDRAVLLDAANRELCVLPRNSPERASELRIYALADYARPDCNGELPFAWGRDQPAQELLYWRGEGARRQLYLLPAPGVRYAIGRTAGGFELRSARRHALAGGEQREVYFHRYVRQEPSAAAAGAARVGRLRDIRSLRVRHTREDQARDSSIEVFLHTPEAARVSVGPQALLTVTSKVANPALLADGAVVAGFEILGAPAAAQLLNLLKLESPSRQFGSLIGQGLLGERAAEPTPGCFAGATTVTIRGMSRLDCAPAGRWFAIGDPQYLQAKVRVAALQVPSTWLAAIWMLALANLLIRAALSLSPGVRVVLVCLEVLLALRLLIATDAALMDPKHEGTVAAAWLALLFLPAAFELTARTTGSALQAGVARLGKLLLLSGGIGLVSTTLGFGTLRAAFAQDVGTVLLVSMALAAVLLSLTWFAAPVTQWLRERYHDGSTPKVAALLLLALAALHMLLALFGVREQIGGLRISTLLVPLLVLAWGNWYVRMARPAASWSDVARALLVAFLPLVGFVLARDNGAYVYFMALAVVLLPLAWPWLATQWLTAVLMGVLATALLLAGFAALDSSFATLSTVALVMAIAGAAGLYLLRRSGRLQLQPHAAWALPAGLAAAGIAALHLGSAVVNAGSTASASQPVQIADLERIVAIDGNSIRLLDLIAPRTVEGLGLRQGYEQRAAMSEMFAYAATLTGRGWPGTTMPRELRVTHVDDAVTAVHLVAPFGRIAALGLAGLLGAFALGSAVLLRAREDVSAQQARLAVATLLTVSLYMLFANIGVVPFTGRNFYFLSVASNSDLLEGGLLLAIVAWALTPAPVDTPSIEARLPAEVQS